MATVGDIWLRAKQRADLEKAGSTGFVSDLEGLRLVQLGIAQLQNLVMNSYEYWVARYQTFNTKPGQQSYPLDSVGIGNLFKLLSVGLTLEGHPENWRPLESFRLGEQSGAMDWDFYTGGSGLRYLLMGQELILRPMDGARCVGVYYVPQPPHFDSLDDELPPWVMNGWDEYPVAFVAWMLAIKERSGASAHREVWQMTAAQIRDSVPNRDSGQPPRMIKPGWCSSGAAWL